MILFSAVYALYEISILLVQVVEKKREEKLRAEGYYDEDSDTDSGGDGQVAEDEPRDAEAGDEPDKGDGR